MSNKIKFARSVNKNNIPAILDYGEPGYIKGQEMIIGNGDGTGFTVNDWNNLINKPDVEDTIVTIVAGETIPAYTPLAVNGSGQGIIADKSSTARARVYGFSLTAGNAGDTINIQVAGDITDPDWSLTPGMTYYLGQAGALVNTYLGFVSTDYVSPLGIAKSPTTLAINIELGFALGVLSINGRSGSITLTASDVGLGKVENVALSSYVKRFGNAVAQSEEVLAYLTVTGAQACRFDIFYYTADMANVRLETLLVAIGANDAITWNAVTTSDIGDTSGIAPEIGTSNSNIQLGFNITEGNWMFSATAYPVTLPGSTVGYSALNI